MLDIFGIDANEFFGKKGQEISTLTISEQDYIKKHRTLDEHGKKMVDFTLNEEHERIMRLEKERYEKELREIEYKARERREKQREKMAYIAAEPDGEEEDKLIEMKVYWQSVAAGIGNYLIDDSGYDKMIFPANEVPGRADFGLRVSGDSMEPKISDGDIVWVKAAPQIENDEIGIFILDGNALCKKLHIDYNKRKVTLVSLNPKRSNIEIEEDANLRTIGKVLLKKY
jgi:phage repressor protein C with HTH and peptisase S24 domain